MVSIRGREKVCKDSIIGIRSVLIAPYFKLTRSQKQLHNLSLISFPKTDFYKFKVNDISTFSQVHKFSDSGDSFDIQTNFIFNKITEFDSMNFSRFIKQDMFIVIEDKMNNYFLLGLENGMRLENLELNNQQYNISFSGLEETITPYVNDLINMDIIPFNGFNAIFENGNNKILQNNNNLIYE